MGLSLNLADRQVLERAQEVGAQMERRRVTMLTKKNALTNNDQFGICRGKLGSVWTMEKKKKEILVDCPVGFDSVLYYPWLFMDSPGCAKLQIPIP